MSISGIIIIVMGFVFFVYGGLVTFSDRFYKWINKKWDPLKGWEGYPEMRKQWSDKWIIRFDRYGIGAVTFVIGAVMIATLLEKFIQQ